MPFARNSNPVQGLNNSSTENHAGTVCESWVWDVGGAQQPDLKGPLDRRPRAMSSCWGFFDCCPQQSSATLTLPRRCCKGRGCRGRLERQGGFLPVRCCRNDIPEAPGFRDIRSTHSCAKRAGARFRGQPARAWECEARLKASRKMRLPEEMTSLRLPNRKAKTTGALQPKIQFPRKHRKPYFPDKDCGIKASRNFRL